eukprot:m.92442 g.92442  ORF g.92442 m.92442 type:complete len:1209 (+) comp36736_c0_seq1:87-3713(+)
MDSLFFRHFLVVSLLFARAVSGMDDVQMVKYVSSECLDEMKYLHDHASQLHTDVRNLGQKAMEEKDNGIRESLWHVNDMYRKTGDLNDVRRKAIRLMSKPSFVEASEAYESDSSRYSEFASNYQKIKDYNREIKEMTVDCFNEAKTVETELSEGAMKNVTGDLSEAVIEQANVIKNMPAYNASDVDSNQTNAQFDEDVKNAEGATQKTADILKEEDKRSSSQEVVEAMAKAAEGASKSLEHAATAARIAAEKSEEAEFEAKKHVNESMKQNNELHLAKKLSDAVRQTANITEMAVKVTKHGQADHITHAKAVVEKAVQVAKDVLKYSTNPNVTAAARKLKMFAQEGKFSASAHEKHRVKVFNHAIWSIRHWIAMARRAAEAARKHKEAEAKALHGAADSASVAAKAAETATPKSAHTLAQVLHNAARLAKASVERVHEAIKNATEAKKKKEMEAGMKNYTAKAAVLQSRLHAAEISAKVVEERLENVRARGNEAKKEKVMAVAMKEETVSHSQAALSSTGIKAAKTLQCAANAIRHALYYHHRPKYIHYALAVLRNSSRHATDAQKHAIEDAVKKIVGRLHELSGHGHRMDGEALRHKDVAIKHAVEAAQAAVDGARHAAKVAEQHRTNESMKIAEALLHAANAVEKTVKELKEGEKENRHKHGGKLHTSLHHARLIAAQVYHTIEKIMRAHRKEAEAKHAAAKAQHMKINGTLLQARVARANHALSVAREFLAKIKEASEKTRRAKMDAGNQTEAAKGMKSPHDKTRATTEALHTALVAAQQAREAARHHRSFFFRQTIRRFREAIQHAREAANKTKYPEESNMVRQLNTTAKEGQAVVNMATKAKMAAVRMATETVAKAVAVAKAAAMHASQNYSNNATIQRMMARVHGAAIFGQVAVDATHFLNNATTNTSSEKHHDMVHGAAHKLVEAAKDARDKMDNFTRMIVLARGRRVEMETKVVMKAAYNSTNRTAAIRQGIVAFIDETRVLHQFSQDVQVYQIRADQLVIPPIPRHGDSACVVYKSLARVMNNILAIVIEAHGRWAQLNKDYVENEQLAQQALAEMNQLMRNKSATIANDTTQTVPALSMALKDGYSKWRQIAHNLLVQKDGHEYQSVLSHISNRVQAASGYHLKEYIQRSIGAVMTSVSPEVQQVIARLERNIDTMLHGTLYGAQGAIHAVRNDLHYLQGVVSRIYCPKFLGSAFYYQ